MKKQIIISAITLALAPLASFAEDAAPAAPAPNGQHHGGGRMNPEERVKAMKESLGLTDDQVAKIQAIFQQDGDKLKALHDGNTLSQDDRRAKSKEIMTSSREAVNQVLTPDQQAKWKAEMEKRRAEHQNGGQPK